MQNKEKRSLEQKLKDAIIALEENTGKKGLTGDELLNEVFATTDSDKEGDELSSQDTNKLEFLINLEMDLSNGTFRLEPEIFFKDDLTLRSFVTAIHEAEDAEEHQDFEQIEELSQEEVEESVSEDSDDDEEETEEE